LIYINDLPQASQLTVKLFADDTALTLSDVCIKQLNCNTNKHKELMKINHWMNINKLSLNYTKTQIHDYQQKKHTDKRKIKLGEHIIEQLEQIKYLQT